MQYSNVQLQPNELTIRPATVSDIPVIQQIAYHTWPTAYGSILSEGQISYMLQLIYSTTSLGNQIETQHFFIAFNQQEAIGFAAFSKRNADVYKLEKLYVLPGKQRLHAGSGLLLKVESAVRAMEGKRLQLNVNRHNVAKGFYERQGFTITYEEDTDIGEGYFMNDYVMEKAL